MVVNNTSTLTLQSILEKDKLNESNFIDWYRNLRKFLEQERKLYVIEQPISEPPSPSASSSERCAYEKHQDDALDVSCVMLATMNSNLQMQHEELNAFDMMEHLKQLFLGQARQKRIDVAKALFECKMAEGTPVETHVLKIIDFVESLDILGFPLSQELAVDVVLQSLPKSYTQFVINYNMVNLDQSLPELLSMLKTAEANMNKSKPSTVMMVQKGKKKGKSKARDKMANGKTKDKCKALKPKGVAKKGNCYHCGISGHWKRNCKAFLEDLKKMKRSETSPSGIVL